MASWQLRGDAENASVFLVDGWAAESEGPMGQGYRWSVSTCPRIVVPAPAPGSGVVTLRMELMPFTFEASVTSQEFWVFVNGAFVFFDRISGTKTISGTVPAPVLMGSTLPISLVLPGACMPSDVGAGPDRRLLGVALRRLELVS